MTVKQNIGKFIIKRLPFSKEAFDILRFEFKAFRVRLNNKLNPFARLKINKCTKCNDLSVNLAAGPFGEKGWVNMDMSKLDNISFTYDCRKKLPFKNETVSRIRCEHMMEHLSLTDEVPKLLNECLRVMKKGGVLRIIVPDIEIFIEAYYLKSKEKWANLHYDINNLPEGIPSPAYMLNHVFRQDGEHKFGYDYEALSKLILKSGFSEIKKQEWGKSIDPKLCNDQRNHKPYSLYVDCIK